MSHDDGHVKRLRNPELYESTTSSAVLIRTGLFLLGGLGMLLLGAAVQPRFKSAKVEPEEQRVLFPELSDAA